MSPPSSPQHYHQLNNSALISNTTRPLVVEQFTRIRVAARKVYYVCNEKKTAGKSFQISLVRHVTL